MVSCMNKQTSGGSRPSDKGGGGGHPDPEIRGGWSKKIFFRHFGPHFGLSIRAAGLSPRSATADGVAMGSPLGPLLANVFMCSIEDRLEQEGKMPTCYRRFVGDTPPSCETKHLGKIFLETFNQCHSSVMFTVEIESNCMLPFLGTQLLNRSSRRGDQSECQTTNIGLLLPYKSHVDVRYKRAFAKNYAWSVLSDFCWSVFLRRMRSS